MEILYTLPILYAIAAIGTAIVMSFLCFVENYIYYGYQYEFNILELLFAIGISCVEGIVCGVVFPVILYKNIMGST